MPLHPRTRWPPTARRQSRRRPNAARRRRRPDRPGGRPVGTRYCDDHRRAGAPRPEGLGTPMHVMSPRVECLACLARVPNTPDVSKRIPKRRRRFETNSETPILAVAHTPFPTGMSAGLRERTPERGASAVPLLHFTLGFRDSGTAPAPSPDHRAPPKRCSRPKSVFEDPGPELAFRELLEPPSASTTSRPRPTASPQNGGAIDSARGSYPALRRTSSSRPDCEQAHGPAASTSGFTPDSRVASCIVLRSCFRPGTRLGLLRRPPARCVIGPEDPTSCASGVAPLSEDSGAAGRRCHDLFDSLLKEQ